MNKILTLLVLLLVAFAAGCIGDKTDDRTTDTDNTTTTESGSLAVAMKDKPIAGVGEVSRIDLTIKSIQVHSSSQSSVSASENDSSVEAAGWTTVFTGTKMINLLEFTGNASVLIGTTNLTEGNYQQVRLYVESATMAANNTTTALDVPSVIKIVSGFEVEANETTLLTLDWDVEKSITATGNGTYRMRPTIQVDEESDVDLSVKTNIKIDADVAARTGLNVRVL